MFLALVLAATGASAQTDVPDHLARAVESPLRPQADRDRDPIQKPAQVLAFAGVRPGQRVADFWPAPPYSTRLLSLAVGPKGHVYAILPAKQAGEEPAAVADIGKSLAPFANVEMQVQPFDAFKAAQPLDMVWMGKIYHDFPNAAEMGPIDRAAVNRAVFAALKPGGTYIVIDHVGAAGYLDSEPDGKKRLHRIDPAVVRREVEAAGFRLAAESPLLANPADDHTKSVFSPEMRNGTDRFVFKFVKPR
jgi:predicted methyltransferase